MTDNGERETSLTAASTRGFLFADLRGYSDFVERHGAAAAAELLVRYRTLVREAVARFQGAEIQTEGDSFFVVFESVSGAVRCGLAIAAAAGTSSQETAAQPIRVGIGIHAGETIETADGYVGSGVNIAARICAQAAAGEVLVSETVRALTRTVLPVRFEPRGRPQLKGIADRVPLYAVIDVAGPGSPWAQRTSRRRRGFLLAAVVVALAVVVAGSAWWLGRRPAGLPAGVWKIGLDMPLSGDTEVRGLPQRNAVELALDDLNGAFGADGPTLALDARDDADSPDLAAENAGAFVADSATLAMIGPWRSAVAYSVIPVTNAAGLLECSPANTLPELTKPRYGALDLRAANPDRISYVRLAPSDDIQGPALASFAFNDLAARYALVIDDTDIGRDIADQFQEEFQKLGGRTIRRALNTGSDPNLVLEPLLEPANPADVPNLVFFGGFAETGGVAVRLAMAEAGQLSTPLLSWDGLLGSGAEEGSYIAGAGAETALGSYIAHASLPDARFSFADEYRRRYGSEPDEYVAAGYACVQIVFASLAGIAAQGPAATDLRELTRAYAVNPEHRYETVLGTVGFDENGDALQQFVTFYRVDASAAGGAGDWVITKKQDFGPAP